MILFLSRLCYLKLRETIIIVTESLLSIIVKIASVQIRIIYLSVETLRNLLNKLRQSCVTREIDRSNLNDYRRMDIVSATTMHFEVH